MSDADRAFRAALALRQGGQPERADALCAQVLDTDPRYTNAYLLRGQLALERGDLARGIDLIERALAIDPNQALACSNIGNALLAAGDPGRALERFDQALRLKPELTIAHFNRGIALKALGRLEEALASYDAALHLDPSHAMATNNRGIVLQELGRLEESAACFGRASSVGAGFARSENNLVTVLLMLGRPLEALAAAERMLESRPNDPEALCARGNALAALDRYDEAIACYSLALEANSEHREALLGRAAAQQRQNRLEAALVDCERALRLCPESVPALTLAGNVLLGSSRAAAALSCFDRGLRLAPNDGGALHGRGAALLTLGRLEAAAEAFAAVLRVQPDNYSALGNLFQLRMQTCDWHDHDELSAQVLDSMRRTRKFVTPLALLLQDEPELGLVCARAFVEAQIPADVSSRTVASPTARKQQGRRRLAYVSADFCDHPVAHLLVGVLERHDRRRFEVIGVLLRPRGAGQFEQRVHRAFDRCIDAVGMSDREVADRLRAEGVDIAVDLMGFTEGARPGIFAHRAAPVQVNYLGYAGTAGAPYMDYILADAVVVPPGYDRWYSERVVRLPHCCLPTDDRRIVAPPPSRVAAGLPPRGFVFCAFTKAHKITPPMFQVWMRLLGAADGSVLWLRDMGDAARTRLTRTAAHFGIDGERLVFAPRLPGAAEHLGRLSLADLYLDTLPYNAHSTACDALWAGVPVLTCLGNSFASRVAGSILAAAGLPELITDSLVSYERSGYELVQRPDRLRRFRARLEPPRSRLPLFDTARYTRDLETAFWGMLETH